MLLSRKRPHSPDIDEHSCEQNKCYPTFVLESESPQPTDEDSESSYSVQMAGTASPKDTSDTSWSSDALPMDVEMVEYDVASITHSDEKLMSNCDSSGTNEKICTAAVATVLVASTLSEDRDLWADSSDSSSDTTDSEVPRADYWDCVRCKSKCSPLNPYCLKCFQLRKGYFPERPKRLHPRRKKKRKVSPPRKTSAGSAVAEVKTERVLTPACESPNEQLGTLEKGDSGIHMGSSERQSVPECSVSGGTSSQEPLLETQDLTPPVEETEREKYLSSQRSELCFMCVERPRNGGFSHKTAVHILCCYQCSLQTWNRIRKCPLCNKKAQNVVKLIYG